MQNNFSNVDFQPLFDWINTKIGQDIELSIDLSNSKRPNIVCPNIQNWAGIFSAVVREVTINFFSFGKTEDGLWGTISMNYESWNGGSNGMIIGNVWFSTESGWKFESAKERFKKYQDEN